MFSKNGLDAGPLRRLLWTRQWSLATRLTLWYTVSAFALVLVATSLLYFGLIRNLNREDDGFLADKVRILRVLLDEPREHAKEIEQEVELEWSVSRHAPMYVRILDGTGRELMATPGMGEKLPLNLFPTPNDADSEDIPGVDVRSRSGPPFRVVVARISASTSAEKASEIQVAFDRSRDQVLERAYRRQLMIILSLALLACAAVGYLIAHRGIRPVKRISEIVETIGSANIHERAPLAGLPTELSTLAASFNQMLDRLEDAFRRLAQFSADVAHELRTPINNLRGEAQVALSRTRSADEYREVLGSCLEESERLYRTIDSLLFLARAEFPESYRVERVQVDVGEELEKVREFYESMANDKGITLTVKTNGASSVSIEGSLIQRALGNLIDNSLAHTSEGGSISVTASTEGGSLFVKVSDTGCGIPLADLPYVFDRLYRVDRARASGTNGAGLGLAIVKSIATLHGGTCSIASELGRGTNVTIRLPDHR
jgi:two-component system heavy metal sensor histidine kinase CusS